MFVKVFGGAFLALSIGAGAALAQSAADVGGPRERPPASFAGQQFVDSRGCVFLRAGLGGTVNWVPRVDANRRAMCGYPPTFGGSAKPAPTAVAQAPEPAPMAPDAKPAPAPVRTAGEPSPETYMPAPVRGVAPMPAATMPVAPRPMAVSTSAPVAAPRPVMQVERPGSGRKIACTSAAPVAQRLQLTNGGTVVVCTRGDGTLEGLRAPAYPAGSRVGASIEAPGRVVPLGQPSGVGDGTPGRVVRDDVAVPDGYKLAWEDDRLNPLRGVGTAAGQAQQDQVWTRQVPARLTTDRPQGFFAFLQPRQRVVTGSKSPGVEATRVALSTKSEPAAQVRAASGVGAYVQVGSFGVPSNADGAAARLAALGLPVARSNGRIGGKSVQVVLAGPFGSAAEAQAALRSARGAGFGDAFIR